MTKKNEIRMLIVSRKAFFLILEAFLYDKIRGIDPPEDYHGIISEADRKSIWSNARFASGASPMICGDDEIILSYQSDTITRLHDLGFSYRVVDRKGDGAEDQPSLFDGEDQEDEDEA